MDCEEIMSADAESRIIGDGRDGRATVSISRGM